MEYRILGNSGIKVSVICLGTMTFGDQNTQEEGFTQLDYALDQGVNFIDTAELYPVPPRAATYTGTETIIGNWIASRKNREKFVLATKIAGPSAGLTWIREGKTDFSGSQIREACHASLKRLQTDYIDLYQLHWPTRKANFFGRLDYIHTDEPCSSFIETIQALEQLKNEGKIRAWGISNETAWGALTYMHEAKNLGLPGPASIQNPYSLLNRSFEVGLAEVAHRENLPLLAYSPLGFGVLSGKYLKGQKPEGSRLFLWSDHFKRYSNNNSMSTTAKYCSLAEKWGLPPAQMALAFVNQRPFLCSTIIGASNMDQLKMNINSINIRLDEEQMNALAQIHAQASHPAP